MFSAKDSRLRQLKEQFYGKSFIWKVPLSSEKSGDPTRCTGVRERQEDGVICLDLSHGMPVPIDKVNIHLESSGFDAGEPPKVSESDSEFSRDNIIPNRPIPNNNTEFNMESPKITKVDIFENFKKISTTFKVDVRIELPEPDLVEMMYKNSSDKDKFIENFSNYVLSNVTIDNIKDSIIKNLTDDDGDDYDDSIINNISSHE